MLLCLLVLAVVAARGAAYRLYPDPYPAEVRAASAASGLDRRLLLAVIRTESGFRPGARSADGAIGLMQLTPATAAWIAGWTGLPPPSAQLLADPGYNVRAGAWYLARLRRAFGGRLAPAVAAYNAGPRRVAGWLASGTWDGTAAGSGAIPFPETRRFLQRVLGAYAVYRVLYQP